MEDAVRGALTYIGKRRRRERPTVIPLDHEPGQRLEADFGHLYVDLPDGRRLVPVLLLTWAYSHAPFAMAMPTERIEAVLSGMVAGLEFFGSVSREVWWDNPTTLATAILRGRQRQVNERYAALASHYRFDPMFCMPASGWEEPHVENRVYDLQRRWGTPVPAVADLDELNAHHLKRLRLPTISAEFQALAREAAAGDEGYERYLLRLTELEVAARQTNALAARIKQASFPVHRCTRTSTPTTSASCPASTSRRSSRVIHTHRGYAAVSPSHPQLPVILPGPQACYFAPIYGWRHGPPGAGPSKGPLPNG